jgi:hypothetical protein
MTFLSASIDRSFLPSWLFHSLFMLTFKLTSYIFDGPV